MSVVPYAIQRALGPQEQQGDPVRDRAAAARSALDQLVGSMLSPALSNVTRTPDYTPTPMPQPSGGGYGGGYSGGGGTGGANPDFVRRLQALVAASGGRVKVQGNAWGYRSGAEQARLYAQKPHLAAKPGHSLHERGMAADLSGDLALAHRLAAQFGLRFPMLNPRGSKYEPWHVQLG